MERLLYSYAPQMRDYDSRQAVSVWWAPYVMFHCGLPNVTTPSLNTDEYGVRYTIDSGGRRVSPETLPDVNPEGRPVSLLIGGSTALGVGASNDSTTVASLLSQSDGELWINLGHGSWVLQQNLIQFLFTRPRLGKIDRIVLFAGLNELDIYARSNMTTVPYGPFYYWREFFSAMNAKYKDDALAEFVFPGVMDGMVVRLAEAGMRRSVLLETLRTCVSNWALIARAYESRTMFCLQPVLAWIRRRWASEEEELLADRLKTYPNEPALFESQRVAYTEWYREALEDMCEDFGFAFLDLNQSFEDSNLDGQFLFVDPWHLTDKGSSLVAQAIEKEYASRWPEASSRS